MAAFQSSEPSECHRVWVFSTASHTRWRGNRTATGDARKRVRFSDASGGERHVAVQGV